MNKVSIYGGLGNQMFQYALYKALNKHGKKSRLSFPNFLYHHYRFDLGRAFHIKFAFPLNLLRFFLLHGEIFYKNRLAIRVSRRLIEWYQAKVYTIYAEKIEFEYDGNVFEEDAVFFKGIWQAEQYFKDIKTVLLQEFVFKPPVDKENIAVIEKINNCNAVSIHIRRGDYLQSHWAKSLGVIKDLSYYERSIAYISERTENPYFFVFSDDIEWVKENLQLTNCTYVGHNSGANSYVDMYLMSLCKHNIIANSTFSWWGGWLNKHEDKIVIMPEKWMNDNACPGIFPQEWIKMKV